MFDRESITGWYGRGWRACLGALPTAMQWQVAGRLCVGCLAWLCASIVLSASGDAAELAPAPELTVQRIRVPLPITDNGDTVIKAKIQRALQRLSTSGARASLVLEFSPANSEYGTGNDFDRCMALARYLTSRRTLGRQVRTIAYIPHTIKGHAILVALACEDLLMHPDAEMGDAGIDLIDGMPPDPSTSSSYRQIANARRTVPEAVALGMLNRQLTVLEVETEADVQFVLERDLEEIEQRRTIVDSTVLSPAGECLTFSGRAGREKGFVKELVSDLDELAVALQVDPEALRGDPSLVGGWRPVEVTLTGPVTARMVERVLTTIQEQMRRDDANFILLRIDSPGGSLAESVQLASSLRSLDPNTVRTVAYITGEARADAALIALGCDELIMHRDAILGGEGMGISSDAEIKEAKTALREIFPPHRSWSLPAAVIDRTLEIRKYVNPDNGTVAHFCEEELAEQADPDAWQPGPWVAHDDTALEMTGTEALSLELAQQLVDNFGQLKQAYGLEGDPRLVEPSWAQQIVQALARPEFAALLLLIGFISIYAELQLPGIGIGGFLATLCFLLFFWSKFLDGTAGWLEVTLFIGGLSCLLVEAFVIPGFGVFGLGGGLMIIASLVLASQTFFFPNLGNSYELAQFQRSLLVVGGAFVGIVVAAMTLHRYLPHTPVFNRVLLTPLAEEELADRELRESVVDYDYLLDEQGTTTTPLLPAGKARFGDALVDVLAEGDAVEAGERVVVVDVQGNVVKVRTVSA